MITKRCKYNIRDGAGDYCKLIPMLHEKDYPHKYWRVFCYGNTDHPFCEGAKRNLLKPTHLKTDAFKITAMTPPKNPPTPAAAV